MQALISILISKLRAGGQYKTFDNGFNAGLIEAIQLLERQPKEKAKTLLVGNVRTLLKKAAPFKLKLYKELSETDVEQIIEYIVNRQKLEAIKFYYEATGKALGLKGSKDDIEDLLTAFGSNDHWQNAVLDEIEKDKPARITTDEAMKKHLSTYHLLFKSTRFGIAESIESSQMLQAIKEYKTASGLSLKEAKDELDKVKEEIGK